MCFFSFSILFSSHYFPSCGFICPKLVFRWNSVFQFPKASLLQWYASECSKSYEWFSLQRKEFAVICFSCLLCRPFLRLGFFFSLLSFFLQMYLYSVSCVSLTLNLVLRVTKCKTLNQLWNEMAAAGLTCLWNPLSVNRPIALELTIEMAVVPVCLQAPWTQAESLHFSRIDRLLLSPLCCWKKNRWARKKKCYGANCMFTQIWGEFKIFWACIIWSLCFFLQHMPRYLMPYVQKSAFKITLWTQSVQLIRGNVKQS